MKLITIDKQSYQSLGVKVNEDIIDIEEALTIVTNKNIVTNIMDLIKKGTKAIDDLILYVNGLNLDEDSRYIYREEEIKYAPAITEPSKIICVGLNYKKHADETNLPYPETPILFNKFPNALSGLLNEVKIPKTTE